MASSQEQQQQKNKEVVYQFFEAFDRQDTERMGQLVSSTNYFFHFIGMPPMDWNAHKQLIHAIVRAFPDFHHKLDDMVAEGDKVAVRFTITGTHQGEFQRIESTGKQVYFGGMDLLTVVDGKITEEWVVVDMMGWMQQIGAIPTTLRPATGTSDTASS